MAPEPITTSLPTVPQAPQTVLKIQATELIHQFRPELTNGDIIKLLIRSVGPDQQGLLYYRGLLIPALLPENLSPGDTIQAKVLTQGAQLKLQILEKVSRAENSLTVSLGKIPQLTTQISNDLNQLLREIKVSLAQSVPNMTNAAPSPKPDGLPPTPNIHLPPPAGETASAKTTVVTNQPVKIANPLVPIEQLIHASVAEESPQIQGEQILTQLRQIADPVVLEKVKQSIASFRSSIADMDLKATDASLKLIAKLIDQLRDALSGDKLPPEQLRRLITSLVEESRKIPTKLTAREASSLAAEVGPQQEKAVVGNNGALQNIITSAEKFLDITSRGLQLAMGSLEQLRQFEQLIESQQRLITINPLMHTLGEPAFILFPFLAQGLLRHSEVSISPPGPEEIDDESAEHNTKRYQRLSVTVPLTNLGLITVDVAYCPGEVLVRFTVRDAEVRDYLAARISELEQAVSTRGYGTLEYWISLDGVDTPPNPIFNSSLFLSTPNESVV